MKSQKSQQQREIRAHPKPAIGAVNSLNQAIRQELWYVDTVVASPFRAVRRQLQANGGAWAQSVDEAIWAVQGMMRLPIKILQSAFGESLSAADQAEPQTAAVEHEAESAQD